MGNRSIRLALLSLLLFVFSSALCGQENSWFLDPNPRFIQRLTWTTDDSALRYEVVIEREETGAFRETLRESTVVNYIEVSLRPGNYRYRVTVFDLLGRSGPASEWIHFEVIEAIEPELISFSPDHFYLDEDTEWVLNLTGRNLSPDAEVYLKKAGSAGPAIVPSEYSAASSLDTAKLVFSKQQLTPGDYEVYIKNPGGLEISRGFFRIAFSKPVDFKTPTQPADFYIGLDYVPLIPLYGDLNRLLDQPIFPAGAQIRFGVIPFKWDFGYLGLELAAGWHYFHSTVDAHEISYHLPGPELSILFQKWFPNKVMAITFRAGGGLGITTDLQISGSGEDLSDTVSFLMPRITAGVSFLYLIQRSFYAEAGIDYTHWFTADDSQPGYLRPRIGVGWKF